MKCRLIRAMPGVTPQASGPALIVPLPAGHVIEHPDAHWLVRQGVAEPEDDECRKATADMTRDKLNVAQRKYELVSRGIHPEDYGAFERGEMTGYDEHGEWIPGPNYVEPEFDAVQQAKLELLEQLLGD